MMRVTRRGSQKLFTTPPGKSSRFVGRRVVCLLGTQASPVRFAARTPADSERRHPGWGWGCALGSRHTYWPMGGVIAMACGATNTTRLCLLLLPTTTTTTTTITTTTSYYYYYLLRLTITTTPSCRCATNWFSAGGRRPAGTARDRAAPGHNNVGNSSEQLLTAGSLRPGVESCTVGEAEPCVPAARPEAALSTGGLHTQHGQRDLLVPQPPLVPLGGERVEEACRVAANTHQPALQTAKGAVLTKAKAQPRGRSLSHRARVAHAPIMPGSPKTALGPAAPARTPNPCAAKRRAPHYCAPSEGRCSHTACRAAPATAEAGLPKTPTLARAATATRQQIARPAPPATKSAAVAPHDRS